MDALLLQAARDAGVRVLQPARCEAIEPGDAPTVTVRHGSNNTVETISTSVVLLADGKGALLPARARATGDFGVKAHFTGVDGPRDAIELFGVRGHYGGVAPIEGSGPLSPGLRGEGGGGGPSDDTCEAPDVAGSAPRSVADGPGKTVGIGEPVRDANPARPKNSLRESRIPSFGPSPQPPPLRTGERGPERWNAAFNVPGKLLNEFRGDLDELFASAVLQNPALRERFASANRVGPWLTSPLPRFGVAREWPRGVIPIGNAAAALEPIGGEGMGLAMRSAELAATALADAWDAGGAVNTRSLRASFNALWKTRRFACRAVALLVSQPVLSGAALDWVRCNERLAAATLRLLGKAG
jgi:2-polyprenyl-6-methoxyphenol hydroxylase-like FAD-dependent oxidoreductase